MSLHFFAICRVPFTIACQPRTTGGVAVVGWGSSVSIQDHAIGLIAAASSDGSVERFCSMPGNVNGTHHALSNDNRIPQLMAEFNGGIEARNPVGSKSLGQRLSCLIGPLRVFQCTAYHSTVFPRLSFPSID